MRRILVDGEPGAVGRELEEHAAGFAEVHRLEPEAIDHRSRVEPGRFDVAAQIELVRIVVHTPGEMMYAADAPSAAPRFGGRADVRHAGRAFGTVSRPAALDAERLQPEDGREKAHRRRRIALPHLRAEEPADLVLGRDRAVVPRRERPARRRLDQRDVQAVRIAERHDRLTEARLWYDRRAV